MVKIADFNTIFGAALAINLGYYIVRDRVDALSADLDQETNRVRALAAIARARNDDAKSAQYSQLITDNLLQRAKLSSIRYHLLLQFPHSG